MGVVPVENPYRSDVGADEELMVQVQAGDEGALEALIDRYRAPLYGFLHRRTEPAHCDDLFQETWIRVVRARKRFDPQKRFSTWMFQIANNLCRDRARRRGAEARRREAVALAARASRDERGSEPALGLDMRERLAQLPGRLREVLVLRYYQGLSEREIAEAVGIPPGTVKSRLFSAVRALRAQEEDTDGNDDENEGAAR